MTQALAQLVELLDLEEVEQNIFRGQNEGVERTRLFGGQVAAQSLVAAGRTVDNRTAHSLHAYFLRGGDPAIPVVYMVDRIRDGRSFTTRRVVALQHGQAIFNMSVSFHNAEESYEHQREMPDAPSPEELPTWAERVEQMRDKLPDEMRGWIEAERPIELRSNQPQTWFAKGPTSPENLTWLRANGRLESDDLLLHQCVLTYASDMGLLDTVYRPHRRSFERNVMMASLDHAVWFHRPFRADEWLLYATESPVATGARGFARGALYTRDGVMVASVAQEGLMRKLSGAGRPESR